MKPFEARVTEQWSLPVDDVRTLCVSTSDSAIRVAGAAIDQIHVHAIKTVRAATEAAARAFLEQMKVERRREGERWVIEATWPSPRPHGVESAGVAFEIQAPHGIHLEAKSSNGAIEATGINQARLRTSNGQITAREIAASLEARTSNGAVRVEGCAGPVDAKTENGRIEVRRAESEVRAITSNGAIQVESCAGPVELKTENGRIEVLQTRNAITAHTCNGAIRTEACPGPIEARTSSGEIVIHQALERVLARASDGRIEVELASGQTAPEAELTTSNSSIDLRLPETVSAKLVADTSNARISMEPSASGRVSAGATHLEAVLGDGEGSIRLRTSNGPIRIRLTG